jgi:hypothetical protein
MVVRGTLPEPGVRAEQILEDADKFFSAAYERHLADIVAEDAQVAKRNRTKRRRVFLSYRRS